MLRSRFALLLAASAAALASAALASALPARPAPGRGGWPGAVRVGTVNLSAIVNLTVVEADDDEIEAMGVGGAEVRALFQRHTALERRLRELDAALAELAEGAPGREALDRERDRADAALRGFARDAPARLAALRDGWLERLHADIAACAKMVAKRDGYDLLMVDDTSGSLSDDRDARTRLRGQRVLWADDTLDVTQDVLECLRNLRS